MYSRKVIKKWIVGEIRDRRLGVHADVHYSPKHKDFWCVIGEDLFTDPSQEGLERAAYRHIKDLKERAKLEWRGIILIRRPEMWGASDPTTVYVTLGVTRVWVSENLAGERRSARWECPPKDRLNRSSVYQRGDAVEIPYTEDAWRGVMSIKAAIEKARVQLDTVCGAPKDTITAFLEGIASGSVGLLETGTKNDEDPDSSS